MSNISREKNLFVRTSIYDDAVKLLKENNILPKAKRNLRKYKNKTH